MDRLSNLMYAAHAKVLNDIYFEINHNILDILCIISHILRTSSDVSVMSTTKKPPEPKTERFYRVAEKRVNNVLNSVRLLGQCSNTRLYEYTDDDVQRMFREIERELRNARQSFVAQERDRQFKFDSK